MPKKRRNQSRTLPSRQCKKPKMLSNLRKNRDSINYDESGYDILDYIDDSDLNEEDINTLEPDTVNTKNAKIVEDITVKDTTILTESNISLGKKAVYFSKRSSISESDKVGCNLRSKKSKRSISPPDSEKMFIVEKIIDMKMVERKRHFYLKWESFPETENSWEPEENIESKDIIKEYLEELKKIKSTNSDSIIEQSDVIKLNVIDNQNEMMKIIDVEQSLLPIDNSLNNETKECSMELINKIESPKEEIPIKKHEKRKSRKKCKRLIINKNKCQIVKKSEIETRDKLNDTPLVAVVEVELEGIVTANTEERKLITCDDAVLIANEDTSLMTNTGTAIITNEESTLLANEDAAVITNKEPELNANEDVALNANEDTVVITNKEHALIANEDTALIANNGTALLVPVDKLNQPITKECEELNTDNQADLTLGSKSSKECDGNSVASDKEICDENEKLCDNVVSATEERMNNSDCVGSSQSNKENEIDVTEKTNESENHNEDLNLDNDDESESEEEDEQQQSDDAAKTDVSDEEFNSESRKISKITKSNLNVYFPENLPQNVQEIFQVEKILRMRWNRGLRYFFLKWEGFPDSENSWEPESNLECPELIEDFLEDLKRPKSKKPVKPLKPLKPLKKLKRTLPQVTKPLVLETLPDEVKIKEPVVKPKGFPKDREPEIILGSGIVNDELNFLIKWKNIDMANLVPAKRANIECPQAVIRFYENNLRWQNMDGSITTTSAERVIVDDETDEKRRERIDTKKEQRKLQCNSLSKIAPRKVGRPCTKALAAGLVQSRKLTSGASRMLNIINSFQSRKSQLSEASRQMSTLDKLQEPPISTYSYDTMDVPGNESWQSNPNNSQNKVANQYNPPGTTLNVTNQLGTPLNTINQLGTPLNAINPSGTPQNAMNPLGTPQNAMNPLGTPQNVFNPLGTPQNVFNPLGTPQNVTILLGTPQNVTNPLGTPQNVAIPLGTPLHVFNPSGTPQNVINQLETLTHVANLRDTPQGDTNRYDSIEASKVVYSQHSSIDTLKDTRYQWHRYDIPNDVTSKSSSNNNSKNVSQKPASKTVPRRTKPHKIPKSVNRHIYESIDLTDDGVSPYESLGMPDGVSRQYESRDIPKDPSPPSDQNFDFPKPNLQLPAAISSSTLACHDMIPNAQFYVAQAPIDMKPQLPLTSQNLVNIASATNNHAALFPSRSYQNFTSQAAIAPSPNHQMGRVSSSPALADQRSFQQMMHTLPANAHLQQPYNNNLQNPSNLSTKQQLQLNITNNLRNIAQNPNSMQYQHRQPNQSSSGQLVNGTDCSQQRQSQGQVNGLMSPFQLSTSYMSPAQSQNAQYISSNNIHYQSPLTNEQINSQQHNPHSTQNNTGIIYQNQYSPVQYQYIVNGNNFQPATNAANNFAMPVNQNQIFYPQTGNSSSLRTIQPRKPEYPAQNNQLSAMIDQQSQLQTQQNNQLLINSYLNLGAYL